MRRKNRRARNLAISVASAAVLVATVASIGSAAAQVYPSRPITMIAPFPAGGAADALARTMAERMRVSLNQPVIVENVTGASGSIGTGRVARAAGDGYTVGIGTAATHVFNGAIMALQYDGLKDFEPVSLLASQPMLIVGRKTMPAKDMKELIAWLKANPDKATQGTAGPASVMHFAGVLFQKETGTRFGAVPYRGSNLALQDLVTGQIDMMIDLAPISLPQVRAGRIKAYAVTAKRRPAAAPEIPTVDEADLPGFYVTSWFGLWAPKGTPKSVIAKLNAAVVDALADPALRALLADPRAGDFPARAADTRGAGRLPQGRSREMVADHQSSGHQGELGSS